MRFRKAVPVQNQSDNDLFAVGTLVARVRPLGLGIAQGLTFKIRRGQVVQVDGVVQIEQGLFPLG
jgi:hypothetical protein